MGTIWSVEEKTFHTLTESREKSLITWADDELTHPHISSLPREDLKHRNPKLSFSFHGRNGKNGALKNKSQSLGAIVEELYSSGPEQSLEDFEIKKLFIPRIKLTRSLSSLKEERRHKAQLKMSGKPESHDFAAESENSQQCLYLPNEDKSVRFDADQPGIFPKNEYELPKKADENYFANNFDECMKRLQLIEKEQEMIEKDDDAANIHLYFLSGDKPEEVRGKDHGKMSSGNDSEEQREGKKSENVENVAALETVEKGGATPPDTREPKPEWYTSLKQQFEGSEEEYQDQKAKEMSCRIMGATLKNSNDPQKPENKGTDTRHYFSRLVKSNKSLIDEELPDPDKVKNIRAMFQENLNSTLKRKLNKKLGGSLQNINARASEQHMARPLSAQCNRDEIVGEIRDHHDSEKPNKTPEISETKDSDKEFQIENTKKKLFEKYDKELKIGRDLKGRKLLSQKWTDTGSMSSGVSSDLSSYDTDVESFSREGIEHEPDEVTISDDDLLDEGKDKHYVQNEILEKIRSFGTSVTYYGGEMITCSVGPLLSPTTQAIMEEIGVKYGDEVGGTRSFDEFYRKYVETNEPNRKKKLGRARSFGQNDVFQKPNVLSNREIEIYKNDLEVEIGIKKPSGIPLNGLKPKLAKSNSVGNSSEKSLETFSQPPVIKIDAATEDAPLEDEIHSESEDVQPETESAQSRLDDEEALHEGNSKPVERDSQVTIKSEESEKSEYVDIITNNGTPDEISEGKEFPAEDAPSREIKLDSAPKEILFGYERSYLNGKPAQDMEFEEFQVCETVEEKLEKLQELNSSRSMEKNDTPTDVDAISESGREEDASKTNSPRRKWNINLNEETDASKTVASVETEHGGPEFPAHEAFNNEKNRNDAMFYLEHQSSVTENNQSNKKYPEHNHSRWPIKTSVMVDMQKTDEQTPKLLSNGKTVAKTKIRLF